MQMQNTMVNSASNTGTTSSAWWNSGLPLISTLGQAKNVNSQMVNRVTGPDSMSSQSQHDLQLRDSNFNDRCCSVQSGNENGIHSSKPDVQSKNVASTGVFYPAPSIDFRQSFACVPDTYGEPYSGGMFHLYGSHAVINAHVSRLESSRVPLPRQPCDEELIYVNPKQYHGILRRRQLRAKLEAQNKHTKSRKPYLHESRHLHAMRRVRGSGGRFLNTKQHQQNQKATHPPSTQSETKTTSLTVPSSSNVANIFCQNQNDYSNQNNYSRHTSYNGQFSGEGVLRWVLTTLP